MEDACSDFLQEIYFEKLDTQGSLNTPIIHKMMDDDPVQEIVSKALELKADGIIIGAQKAGLLLRHYS